MKKTTPIRSVAVAPAEDAQNKSLLLSARAQARLEAAAAAFHTEATSERGFQAVSSKDGFSAVIKHGRTLIEISGDDFAVRQID